jgi:indole-3-glycerol phosphate synthase
MLSDFLEKVVVYKRGIIKDREAYYENLKKNVDKAKYTQYHVFKKAVSRPGQMNLIAEVKRASPSRGLIREDFDVRKIAKIYQDNGAAAISVLTEDKYFLGKPDDLHDVSDLVSVPTLMKDFVLSEYQIYEGFICGANAVLLIVAILSNDELQHLMETADRLGMDCLVEVHDEQELSRAIAVGAGIIGINNRNLRTLVVDRETSEALAKKIPHGRVIVAESGLNTNEDIKALKKNGVHAVLIGEAFMREQDIAKKMKDVMGQELVLPPKDDKSQKPR